MLETLSTQQQQGNQVMTLVSTALRQKELAGLSEMLMCIAKAVNAYGCILWEVAPLCNLDTDPPEGRLFVLAEWFDDKSVFATHNMSLTESVNGSVIINQEPLNIPNIREDKLAYSNPANKQVIDSMKLETMCSVPVTFTEREKNKSSKGTISLYRNIPVPFTDNEFSQVQQLALLVPELYQAVRDKVGRELIYEVNEILHDADLRAVSTLLSKDGMKEVLQQVSNTVAKTFKCIETSIFMQDRFDTDAEYHLVSTTWNFWTKPRKVVYRADAKEGITGWTLANKAAVRIFSLSDFERDKEIIRKEYPGITWKDSLNLKASARKILKLDKKKRTPPLSFMAAPVLRGDDVIGVIRCCTASEVPYYFSDREKELLELVAVQISRFWSNWLIRREIDVERKALADGISGLNSFVQQELRSATPNQYRIFDQTLKVAQDVIKDADILDVRLFDPDSRQLYFAATFGSAWKEGTSAEVKSRLEKIFLVDDRGPHRPLGVRVFHSGIAMSVTATPGGYKSETFPQTKRIIVAPIRMQGRIVGVFDLRNTENRDFPDHALKAAEILGQQLGLYLYLTKTIGELRQAEIQHELREKERLQANADLSHQLKNPLIQAHARIRNLLDEKPTGQALTTEMLKVRGQIGKAKRVGMSTGLFAELARQSSVQIEPKRLRPLQYDTIVKMLIEEAMDYKMLTETYRRIEFHVQSDTFEVLNNHEVRVEYDWLEQAVSCLLDNAGKYSFAGAHIYITGGLWTWKEKQWFSICVTNHGMPIKQNEIQKCKERLWRSDQAIGLVGEGSGIGLWVVDHIMKAHKGELVITPTTYQGVTQIRLLFPL